MFEGDFSVFIKFTQWMKLKGQVETNVVEIIQMSTKITTRLWINKSDIMMSMYYAAEISTGISMVAS